jgi:DNA-binding CsgD family transcriptional regulator
LGNFGGIAVDRGHSDRSLPRLGTDHLLVERTTELALVRRSVSDALSGKASAVIVKGQAGLGRSALVRWAGAYAEDLGCRVVMGRCSWTETDQAFGLATQLDADSRPVDARSIPVLCEAFLDRVGERPLVLLVDDAQWIDEESERWLRVLIRRMAGRPLSLVLATSVPWRPSWDQVVFINGTTPVHVLELDPLSADGVRTVVETRHGGPVPERCVVEVAQATGGNPWVLHAVLDGLTPSGEHVLELPARVDEAKGDQIVHLLDGLPAELVGLLRAIAVCGQDIELQLVCSLAGLRVVPPATAIGLLLGAGVVVDERAPRLAHAVAVKCVLAGMTVRQREDLYARAAELGHRSAIADEGLARMLLGARPVGADWALQVLRREASRTGLRGDQPAAAGLLARALREPMDDLCRARLEIELAVAEVSESPDSSDRRLGRVLLGSSGPEALPLRLHAADLLLARGDVDALQRAVIVVCDRQGTTQAESASLTSLYWLAEDAPHDAPELRLPAVPELPERPADPDRAGAAAWEMLVKGRDLATARALALAALSDARSDQLILPRIQACRTLMLTDDVAAATAGLDVVVADARDRGARALTARALVMRAELLARTGLLDQATADLEHALAAMPLHCWHPMRQPLVVSVRAMVDLERGRPDLAERVVDMSWSGGVERSSAWIRLLFVRGMVCLRCEEPKLALELFQECGRRLLARQWVNPALAAWRSQAAIAHHACGETDEAIRLVGEEIRLAEGWGAPSVVGASHLWAGMVLEGADAGWSTARAVRVLRGSPWRLRYGQALAELAAFKLGTGATADAVPLLREAAELASVHGARQLVRRVRELSARISAVLSPSEWRVAELATRGLPNADIARELSVTRRTVEAHLTNIYRKVGIAGRAELGPVLELAGGGRGLDAVGA